MNLCEKAGKLDLFSSRCVARKETRCVCGEVIKPGTVYHRTRRGGNVERECVNKVCSGCGGGE